MLMFEKRSGNAQAAHPGQGKVSWLEELFLARGLDTEEKRQRFLYPDMDTLSDAALLPGALQASQVLSRLRDEGKTVAVYGDYDVDGVCASVIMEETLRAFGLDCFIYVPDRHEEGYGLNMNAVESLAQRCGAILTVDCGIVSHGEVQKARELGLTVIVTDHHRPGDTLPAADAVVCPLLDGYPYPMLCGAGVAWKLCDLLMGRRFAMGRLDLCALATVADMVLLTEENRVLVHFGLDLVGRTKRPGLAALCRRASAHPEDIRSETVSFQLAPRLNAAGRLESAMDAVNLLRTQDAAEAESLSVKLENLNLQRREKQELVLAEAEEQVRCMNLTQCSAIVVLGENWDSGVVGLSAGKLAEKYAYPTVVLTCVEGTDLCVGSARSAGQVDIHRALKECGDLFVRFGGHAAAAGMTLRKEDVPLLRERLSCNVYAQLHGAAPRKRILYDAKMTLADVTQDTVETMERLEPFGMGNPAPMFLFERVELPILRAVGNQGAHLKCSFRQAGQMRDGIAFGMGKRQKMLTGPVDMAAVPTLNRYMGRVTAECQVQAIQLRADTFPDDEERELSAVLQELRYLAENIYEFAEVAAFSAVREIPEAWLKETQGTLLWCRRGETVRRMAEKYPFLPYLEDAKRDPRAYTGISLCPEGFSALYQRVVLCDGLLCDEERQSLLQRYPGTEFVYLSSDSGRNMMKKLHVSLEELRGIYRMLRDMGGDETVCFAERMQMPVSRAQCAFDILCDMHLAEKTEFPRGIRLLPARKTEAEASLLYRLLNRYAE
ncbi:MAG: single-stranded-DNA-specific exonuclease RecJ [Clostridia bacterium]|nr:single-stranded-DNA-specific exonuclease RecJ [Clostridia bacterium]